MKGDQLARVISGRTGPPPVIMLTGFPPNPVPQEIAKVLTKPFDCQVVRSALSQFCLGSKQAEYKKLTACPELHDSAGDITMSLAEGASPGANRTDARSLEHKLAALEEQIVALLREKNETEQRFASTLSHIRHDVAQSVTVAQAFFELLPRVMEQEQLTPEKLKNPQFWLKFSHRAHEAIKAITGILKT
jgi:hypothetical protein